MRYRIAAIAAAALICTVSAVSCGKESDSSSVSVKVGNTTEATAVTTGNEKASDEVTTTGKVTTEAVTTEEKTTEAKAEEVTTEEKTTEAVTTEEKTTEAKTEPQPSYKAIAGNQYLGFVIQELKDVLGEQTMAYMAEACLPVGDDGNAYIYDFSGVKAECYLQNEEHYIATITIESSAFATPEGITVGSLKSEVEAAYGSANVQGNGDLSYSKGAYDLYFTMSGDSVAEIEYMLNY